MKYYLAGPINGCNDSEAHDWREEASALLGAKNVFNPMVRDYRGKEDQSVAEIVELDKADIDACDVLIVWFVKPSIGTSMEVLYAWERGKQIIVVNKQEKPLSPWLVYHSHRIIKDLNEISVE